MEGGVVNHKLMVLMALMIIIFINNAPGLNGIKRERDAVGRRGGH